MLSDFKVPEGINSRLRIESDSTCLWLRADVVLEYTSEEASALLQENLDNANTSIEVLIADLQFLRDQVTIIQVTVTRVYNWVHWRRMKQVTATAVTDLRRLSIIAWLFLSYSSQAGCINFRGC
ncbi:hypothetical protein MKX03_032658 [Papaver bracteatum]|nr:hypothetical protein MKX03_032658 [Papaver bracteatum]